MMAETRKYNPPEVQPQEQLLTFGKEKFSDFLAGMGKICPEIAEKQAGLQRTSGELVTAHTVKPEFFQAEDNRIGLMFAAALQHEASDTMDKSATRIGREKQLARNFARTLFGPYSDTHPLEDVRKTSQLDPEDKLSVYKKYQNEELSRRLHTWFITSEALTETRSKLQLQAGQEQNFNVMVLSVAHISHTKGIGEADDTPENMHAYVESLHERGKSFMNELKTDEKDRLPVGWVETINGIEYLCLPEASARIILEPEAIGFKENQLNNRTKIHALLRHEFTHTQASLQLIDNAKTDNNDTGYLGLFLEEYRAGAFSGGHYPDINNVVQDIERLKGFNIAELMMAIPLGGAQDKPSFYASLAQKMGLAPAAMMTGFLPKIYASFGSPKSSREMYELLGDNGLYDEIVLRMSDEDINSYAKRINVEPEMRKVLWRDFRDIKQERG